MIDSTTVKSFKQGIAKGLGFGVGASIALATTTLLAAAAAMKIFSAGEVISATELNRNFMIASPEREVSAFHLENCPEGWAPADGSNGTPDLRGRFIRGMDDREVVDGGQDADGIRALGNVQDDALQGHAHASQGSFLTGWAVNSIMGSAIGGWALYSATVGSAITDNAYGPHRVSSETRPRNVALIFCMRKN